MQVPLSESESNGMPRAKKSAGNLTAERAPLELTDPLVTGLWRCRCCLPRAAQMRPAPLHPGLNLGIWLRSRNRQEQNLM